MGSCEKHIPYGQEGQWREYDLRVITKETGCGCGLRLRSRLSPLASPVSVRTPREESASEAMFFLSRRITVFGAGVMAQVAVGERDTQGDVGCWVATPISALGRDFFKVCNFELETLAVLGLKVQHLQFKISILALGKHLDIRRGCQDCEHFLRSPPSLGTGLIAK